MVEQARDMREVRQLNVRAHCNTYVLVCSYSCINVIYLKFPVTVTCLFQRSRSTQCPIEKADVAVQQCGDKHTSIVHEEGSCVESPDLYTSGRIKANISPITTKHEFKFQHTTEMYVYSTLGSHSSLSYMYLY